MAGFGHGPAVASEQEDPAQSARNARYGLRLFAVYFVIYAAFVGANAFLPRLMTANVFGVTVAVAYGMGLIIVALLLALVYMWLCRGAAPPASDSRKGGGR